mmetsp:Transcript_26946/g.27180  ORF Transcript_26946/g.27180 Transcript_26946/m.27180 type:complete len:286 (-) Transcript_26946:215-1072(-)|eukprot:CAMPEP_0182427786 /NCGR_PEP_ID=MMETSP1167-20130531/19637_1 /TAXON_ID=2988 /ORGANISM="Mallomonas Sp, Strain CCMP3275" /LENGTH=285 /DNA_ID=CAMNT_0024610269 /DNA_START=88 /DNA_END=945 /DNA_ORIENTATION=-
MKYLLPCIVTLICFQGFTARKMWGTRRRDDEEDNIQASSGFQKYQKQASMMTDDPINPSDLSLGGADSDGVSVIVNLMETYITMMEKLVQSPDFDSMITPETLRTMFSKIPQLSENPQVSELLDSPAFNDPVLLRQTIAEGLKSMRQYMAQIIEMMKSPEQIQALISQLPAEFQGVLTKLLEGDVSGVKDMITTLPGITESQRTMLVKMLEGDAEGMIQSMQDMFSDPDQIEAARQQFLSDPSMAETVGIPVDVLNDKKKFAAYMKESMKGLGQDELSSLSGMAA